MRPVDRGWQARRISGGCDRSKTFQDIFYASDAKKWDQLFLPSDTRETKVMDDLRQARVPRWIFFKNLRDGLAPTSCYSLDWIRARSTTHGSWHILCCLLLMLQRQPHREKNTLKTVLGKRSIDSPLATQIMSLPQPHHHPYPNSSTAPVPPTNCGHRSIRFTSIRAWKLCRLGLRRCSFMSRRRSTACSHSPPTPRALIAWL